MANLTLPASAPTTPMGMGDLGSPELVFKRQFRWTFEIQYCFNSEVPKTVPENFVKSASRPKIEIDELEINYLNGVIWIPGKAKWQTINVTYYDVAGSGISVQNTSSLFGWLASIYDISDPVNLPMGSKQADYEGEARLYLYDGCGTAVEGWLMAHMWPTNIDFGELDMDGNEICTVELTLRYSEVQYKSYCPDATPDKCPCSSCAT